MTESSLTESTIPSGGWSSGEADYLRSLRAAARALALGIIEPGQFVSQVFSIVDHGLTRAWYEGMKECGIRPDEQTAAERARLNTEMVTRLQRIGPLAEFILSQRSRPEVGVPASVAARLRLWANDYRGIKEIASAMACGNKKMTWMLGPTKEHCPSCKGFAGRTYRYSVWLENNALPRMRSLCCSGYQ
jgi:hypothetical protein